MTKVKILYLIFQDLHLKASDIPKLRGYFSKTLQNFIVLHNHTPDGKFNYGFPKVQYRIINGHPALIAIKEGINVVKEVFFKTNEIVINGDPLQTNEKIIQMKEEFFGQTQDFFQYNFVSPWLALNKENYNKYKKANALEKMLLLKKILRGNLISLSKGFDYRIPDIENIKIETLLHSKQVNFKGLKMQGFTGSFMVNFCIPDWLGIGKQSSRALGVVRKQGKQI